MTIVVCNACGEPWEGAGSPAICPKCRVDSFGIAVERHIDIQPDSGSENKTGQDNITPTLAGEGSTKMPMEEMIRSALNQYRNDEVMLDAFFQWASNPTSMSARYGLEKNYPYIEKNLMRRYGLSSTETGKRVSELKRICDGLINEAKQLPVDSKHQTGTGEVQRILKDILSQSDYEKLRRQGALKRLREVSEETRKALLLFNLLENIKATLSANKFTMPPDCSSDYQSEFQAYYNSIFGERAPIDKVAQEIVRSGAYNELFHIYSKGAMSKDAPEQVEAIAFSTAELEALGAKLPPSPDVPLFLESHWQKGEFDLLRWVDIVSHSGYGVITTDEPLPIGASKLGFMGSHGKTIALSPIIWAEAKQHIELIKDQKMEDTRQGLEKALVAVERQVKPEGISVFFWTGQGESVWKFTTSPPLYVYLAPWLTTFSQTTAPSRINFKEKPHILLVIPYQSKASLLGALEKHSGFSLKDTRGEKSLGLLTNLHKPSEFQLLIGQRHPLLDRILEALSQIGLLGPTGLHEDEKVIRVGNKEVIRVGNKEDIRVGNIENHQQHGILAKLGEQNVVLDLYEPHAVSILGVQGSGKSYAAGAIIEMAVNPIPLLSELRKPLSCIIFHFSKEEKRVPEWIGLAEENSSVTQIQKLKTVYGASPSHVHVSQINILVPPTKVVERKQQYKGFNVLPLLFSPSRLKADDWKRLLTFGKGTDALYMEALGEIMIDLRAKKANFGADDLVAEINGSDLNKGQKKFALQRIKIIGRWLSEERSPFIELIKPGVVSFVLEVSIVKHF